MGAWVVHKHEEQEELLEQALWQELGVQGPQLQELLRLSALDLL